MPKSTAAPQTRSRTRAGLRRRRSELQPPSPTPEPQARPTKRRRGRTGQTSAPSKDDAASLPTAAHDADTQPPESEVPSFPVSQEFPPIALEVMHAIQKADRISPIGYSPAQRDKKAEVMMRYGPPELTKEDVRSGTELTEEEKARENHNAAIIAKLSDIYALHVHDSASGYLDKPFRLRITRAKCKFNARIVPPTKFGYLNSPTFSEKDTKATAKRLEQWYTKFSKVDEDIRDARELQATEFSVEPELLERIAVLWDQNFYPNRGIRVEPYKILLFGPFGRFGEYGDTSHKDLVGIFLLGLGDTTKSGGLKVDGETMRAHQGHWCAFYPDVPHRDEMIFWDGYRAVIAFNIFRTSVSGAETETTSRAPLGIMLERKYCLGTTELSGFDALLLQSALALPNVVAKHIPVILTTHTKYGAHNKYDCEENKDYEMSCETVVVPFTRGHIEGLFTQFSHMRDHDDCGSPWLDGVRHVPFFSLELPRSLHLLQPYPEEEEERFKYPCCEAWAWREDSVHLSYALVVVPPQPPSSPAPSLAAILAELRQELSMDQGKKN